MVPHRVGTDLDAGDAEVGELGLVDVLALIERDGDLVDDAVPPLLTDAGLDQPVLTAVDVVVAEDGAHLFDAGANGRLVIGGRVLPQEVLQHVGGHDGIALNGLDEVFSDDDAGEGGCDLTVQLRRRVGGRALTGAWCLHRSGLMSGQL